MRTTTTPDLQARLAALEAELALLKAEVAGRPGDVSNDEGDRALASRAGSAPEAPASRRDLLRAGAVVLGATVAGLTPRPAESANGDPVLIGTSNTGTAITLVSSTASFSLVGYATSAGDGVYGLSDGSSGNGVRGFAGGASGTGVYGVANMSSGVNYGVRGQSNSPSGFAVGGYSPNGGTAVRGELPGTTAANGIAVYGLNNSSYAGPGPGAGGFGVYGLSAKGHGLVGATAATGGAAVVGAANGVPGAYAGAFYGPVVVSGAFTVVGGPKSAAVPHPDGTHRLLYCMESPESWFEDFGKGQLVCGQAEVALDPDFSSIVAMDDYHVFVTEYGQHSDLFVTERTARGFRVQAKDESSSGAFSWRVVARRKDITGERLATIAIPPEPQLPPMAATIDSAPAGTGLSNVRANFAR